MNLKDFLVSDDLFNVFMSYLCYYRREEDEEDYQERVEEQLAAQEEEDVERIKEESRRRRQAILDKYKQPKEQEPQLSEPQQRKVVVDKAPTVNTGNSVGIRFLLFLSWKTSEIIEIVPSLRSF